MLAVLKTFSFFIALMVFLLAPLHSFAKTKKTFKTITSVKNFTNKSVNRKKFNEILRGFVACCRPTRMVSSSGHQKVVPYLTQLIKSMDPLGAGVLTVEKFNGDVNHAIKLYQDDFNIEVKAKYPVQDPFYKKWDGFTKNMISILEKLRNYPGKNIIWEKKGSEINEVLIIGAHFDTIANDKTSLMITPGVEQPGADDNGSGVAVALGLISLLSKIDLKKTVRVIFWDFEEVGFLGSRAYVTQNLKKLKSEKIIGYVNLEMLGHDSRRLDKNKRQGNMKVYIRKSSEAGHQMDNQLAQTLTKLGKKITNSVKFEIVANSFNASDHISFWQEGFPALTFTQNWEDDFNQKRYHTSNDFVETLNLRTLYNSFRYIAGAVVAWSLNI